GLVAVRAGACIRAGRCHKTALSRSAAHSRTRLLVLTYEHTTNTVMWRLPSVRYGLHVKSQLRPRCVDCSLSHGDHHDAACATAVITARGSCKSGSTKRAPASRSRPSVSEPLSTVMGTAPPINAARTSGTESVMSTVSSSE